LLRLVCGGFDVRPILLLLAAMLALAATVTQADARLQRAFVCWEPDNEFPVQCDDDD
jgi:hypothetical protein